MDRLNYHGTFLYIVLISCSTQQPWPESDRSSLTSPSKQDINKHSILICSFVDRLDSSQDLCCSKQSNNVSSSILSWCGAQSWCSFAWFCSLSCWISWFKESSCFSCLLSFPSSTSWSMCVWLKLKELEMLTSGCICFTDPTELEAWLVHLWYMCLSWKVTCSLGFWWYWWHPSTGNCNHLNRLTRITRKL